MARSTREQVIVHNADGVTGSTNDYVNYGSGLVLTQNETNTLNRLRRRRSIPSPITPPMARRPARR